MGVEWTKAGLLIRTGHFITPSGDTGRESIGVPRTEKSILATKADNYNKQGVGYALMWDMQYVCMYV